MAADDARTPGEAHRLLQAVLRAAFPIAAAMVVIAAAAGTLSGLIAGSLVVGLMLLYGRTSGAPSAPPAPLDVTAERVETEVRARTLELRERYEASVAANHTKDEFVANMSHELRTPLNIIIGYTDMLRDDGNGLDARESDRLMARIRTAASNLLHLVDMVLDLGKLEAGKIPVRNTSVPLVDFAEEMARRERIPLAPGVTLRCEADADLPVVETDRAKLTMVLDNLISNAIKFTRAGTITTRVAHRREHALVEFEVEDTGPGIDGRHLATIFEPFHQLERSSDNPFGGVGLGLAIVRRYVELLGGTIAVRSAVGVGTRFTLRLPYRPGDAMPEGMLRPHDAYGPEVTAQPLTVA
jgi:signal transduction histidine kinase